MSVTPVQLQQQIAHAPFDDSPWQVVLGDPSFLLINLGVILLVGMLLWLARRRYGRFYSLQQAAFDHRKSADAQSLAQQQTYERLISQQYGITNSYNAQVVAKAEEALRINADTLVQIVAMNRTLTRIAERLDQQAGGSAA